MSGVSAGAGAGAPSAPSAGAGAPPTSPDELEPCWCCGVPLTVLRDANPRAVCDTEGCWMNSRVMVVLLDDPTQVREWNTRAAPEPNAPEALPDLVKAAQGVIDRKFSTYRTRNGREVSIEADDGEKCWIVHSDDMFELEAALAKAKTTENPEPTEAEAARAERIRIMREDTAYLNDRDNFVGGN